MTHDAVGSPAPASRGPADDACAHIAAGIEALAAVDLHAGGDLAALVEQVTVLQRRLDAVALEAVAVFDAKQAWQADGAASAAAWMRANLRLTPGAARQCVRTARRIGDLPGMREALSAGEISREHVQVVTTAMRRNPARRDTIAAAEGTFAFAARELDPNQLAKAVIRWTHLVDPLGVVANECAIHEQRYLSISRTFDGAVKLDALLGPEQGAIVMTALEAVATGAYRAERAERGSTDTVSEDDDVEEKDPRTPGQRRVDALVDLSKRFLDSGTSGEIAGVRPHLLVTVTDQTLAAARDEAGRDAAELEGVGPVSGEMARRVACDGTVNVLRLDPNGAPLDLGRTQRVVDARLRKALNRRDGGCVFPGCGRPIGWCEAHHIEHWAHGGSTDLRNLALLCSFHHHRIHEHGFSIKGCPQAGTLSFHRPDGTRIADRGRERTWDEGPPSRGP